MRNPDVLPSQRERAYGRQRLIRRYFVPAVAGVEPRNSPVVTYPEPSHCIQLQIHGVGEVSGADLGEVRFVQPERSGLALQPEQSAFRPNPYPTFTVANDFAVLIRVRQAIFDLLQYAAIGRE